MNNFLLFFWREWLLLRRGGGQLLLAIFFWVSGFFLLSLFLLPLTTLVPTDKMLVVTSLLLLLLFFSLVGHGGAAYRADMAMGLLPDIILSGRSVLAFIYGKWLAIFIFAGLPLWLLNGIGFYFFALPFDMYVFLSFLLFVAHASLLINFLSSMLKSNERGDGNLLMVVVLVPLLIPCFLLVLLSLTERQGGHILALQAAYFLFMLALLPPAAAFIISREM